MHSILPAQNQNTGLVMFANTSNLFQHLGNNDFLTKTVSMKLFVTVAHTFLVQDSDKESDKVQINIVNKNQRHLNIRNSSTLKIKLKKCYLKKVLYVIKLLDQSQNISTKPNARLLANDKNGGATVKKVKLHLKLRK